MKTTSENHTGSSERNQTAGQPAAEKEFPPSSAKEVLGKQSRLLLLRNYAIITLSIFIMAVGVYFFKFPNNFSFGGVTGVAVIISRVFHISASGFTFITNLILLIIGLIFLGKDFAIKTGYASVLLSVLLVIFEHVYPMNAPLSSEPMLELIFAIALPSIGSAILFYIGASSGGTDVLAMLFRKYTKVNIGMALFCTDLIFILVACFVFDIQTALYSFVGLTVKSFLIDGILENIQRCKWFCIICKNPDPICDYIVNTLKRSATIADAKGAYTHENKFMVITALRPAQAIQLRQFIHTNSPESFILITNTSEIIGKGFITI